ncbi:MAG: hypothetical protein IPL78_14375 [Chloroflexi bacterium]|nr:hypothetical protein [Chloroflexota bacterium]
MLSDWLTQNDRVTRPIGSPTHAGPLQPMPMIVPTWSTPDTGLETCFLTVRQPGAVLGSPLMLANVRLNQLLPTHHPTEYQAVVATQVSWLIIRLLMSPAVVAGGCVTGVFVTATWPEQNRSANE